MVDLNVLISVILDYIIPFIRQSFLSFKLINADERPYVFVVRASALGMICSMRLDGTKGNHESAKLTKSVLSILDPKLKV